MREILHILTSNADELAAEVIRAQGQMPDCKVGVTDLTKPEPNYDELLEKIFKAESVQVW